MSLDNLSAIQRAANAIEEVADFKFNSHTTLTEIKILARLQSGMNACQAADDLGITRSNAVRIAQKHGLQGRVGRPASVKRE